MLPDMITNKGTTMSVHQPIIIPASQWTALYLQDLDLVGKTAFSHHQMSAPFLAGADNSCHQGQIRTHKHSGCVPTSLAAADKEDKADH